MSLLAADVGEEKPPSSGGMSGLPEGSYLPDTVNVFHIAKEVSEIFVDAVNGSVYNDVHGNPKVLDKIFTNNYTPNDVGQAYKDAINEQISAQRGDFGLNIKGDYTENFTPGLSIEEDLTYKRRFYVGLEWDIIKGGLFDAGNKVHQLKMKAILKEYEALENAEKENYRYLFNYINYLFNKRKVEVLNERKGLIEKQLKYTRQLYHLRYVGWEKVLKYQAKLEDIDQQVSQFEYFNKRIPSNIPDTLLSQDLNADDLPLFDVDLDSLIKVYYDNHSEDTVTKIKLAIYKDNMKWWKDITLKPFVRYNMYVNEFNLFRNYGSAGITAAFPIRFNNKSRLIKSQEMIYQAEQMKELQAGDNELVNIYAEFGFKLKQIKDLYYRKVLIDELIRKELVKKEYHDVGFNPVYTLGLIDDKKAIEGELIDVKKRMYINLVRLSFYLDDRAPSRFIRVLKPSDFSGRYDGSVKMFVSAEDLKEHTPTGVVNYLWKNEFVDVIVENAASTDSLSADLQLMIEKSKLANIFYTIMRKVPKNGTYPDVISDINDILNMNNPHVIGLHYELDFTDYDSTNREVKEVELSDWVNGISQNAVNSDIRISVGITAGLPVSLLNRMFDKFDLVFARDRGFPNMERVKNAYATELNINRDHFVLSLKGTDFADRIHLENYMADLNEQEGINNFAFSDFSSMMHVDFETFEKGNNINLQPEQLIASVRDQIYEKEEEEKQELIQKKIEKQEVQNESPVADTLVVQKENNNDQKIYRIQIAASKKKLSQKVLDQFKATNIREINIDGYYKYTIGNYESEKEAKAALKSYKTESGRVGAFVVTY